AADVRRRRVTEGPAQPRRLLVRDLAQLATPASGSGPVRGARAGDVTIVENAYVLCEAGRVAGVGPMRQLGPLGGDVEELDGSGRCAIPGLVDCHTHACFLGDRVEEFALRARGATYEELHAAGGGILSAVEATRAAGEVWVVGVVTRHCIPMLRTRTTPVWA